MENKGKQCYCCKYLDRFYTRGIKRFNKANCGWCSKQKSVMYIHDDCDCFTHASVRRKNRYLIRHALNELLTELSDIRTVLEAERDDNE